MKHRNIKRLDILWQDGIPSRAFTGVITGLWDILKLAGIAGKMPISSRGMVALPSFLYHKGAEILHPKIDTGPILAIGWRFSGRDGFLNAPAMLDELMDNPLYHCNKERYVLLIVKEKIHWNDETLMALGGCATLGENAVVSLETELQFLNQEQNRDEKKVNQFFLYTRMTIIHELGHIWLLAHCSNACAMSINNNHNVLMSIQNNPLCPSCLEKLRAYFTGNP